MGQPACVYVRISDDREGAGLGVARQEADCRELAARLGYDVAEVYADNDRSAYSGKPRPGYDAMLAGLKAGRYRAVVAWHTDRLHRSPRELEDYIDATGDIPTHTVRAGLLDLSTASGRMTARILGAVARGESEHKGERVAAAYAQRVLNGGFGGGRRRFGFEADGRTVVPGEAAEIAAAVDGVVAGRSLRGMAAGLNARGVVTPLGHGWTPQRLAQVIRRPRNAGLLVYHGREAGPAPWPAIVPEAQWREACRILADPARRSTASNKVSGLGSGLYVCGLCGGRLRIGYSGSGVKVRSYRCPVSPHITCAQAALDSHVALELVARLSLPDTLELFHDAEPDLSGVYAERDILVLRQQQLGSMFTAGAIDRPTLEAGAAEARGRVAELDARIAAAAGRSPLAAVAGPGDVLARWDGLDLAQQRAVLDVLATVTVHRAVTGGRFDPARVQVKLKI